MTAYVIPTDDGDVDVGVTVAADPQYDFEADGGRAVFGFKQSASGLISGIAAGGRRMALRLDGFVPTTRSVVGSAVSFRRGDTIVTYQMNRRRMKERVKFLANPARDRFSFTAVVLDGVVLEQMGDGSIQVRDLATGRVPMRILPPDVIDNVGRNGPARYELSADGLTVTLVLDLAWLATAAYPVSVDPTTTVTSTSIDISATAAVAGQHIFRMNDGSLVALWGDQAAARMKRSRSTDGGATWSAAATPFTWNLYLGVARLGFAGCQDVTNDIILGTATSYDVDGFAETRVWRMAFSAGTFTDSSVVTGEGRGGTHYVGQVAFDSVNNRMLLAYQRWTVTGGPSDNYWSHLQGYNATTLAAAGGVNVLVLNDGSVQVGELGGILCDTASPPVVYWMFARNTTTLRLYRYTYNGTAFTGAPGTEETLPVSATSADYFMNASSQVEGVINQSGALKHFARTGTNTFSSFTTLRASGVVNEYNNVSLVAMMNANSDVLVFWRDTTAQANGEIYYIKRLAGVWGSVVLVAGGFNTGWRSASVIDKIYTGNGKVYSLYLTGTAAPYTLIFSDAVSTGSAPSTPTNILPVGLANTSLTPTVGGRYLNATPLDPLSSYRIVVTRQSDSVVMWDTGKTVYSGSAITDGMDYSRVYAGTVLAKGVTYLMQIKFWDLWMDLEGPFNAAVTFQVNDAPTVTITSSAAPATSGPIVTWTYSQALSHAQASYRVRVLLVSSGAVVYDSGTIASAVTTHGIPTGTLQNGVAYTLEVTATSTDGL